MDDFSNLLVLCTLMFVLTYIIGYLPMIFKLSENKLESISIFGAGFLLGTALIVIVPEGLSVLMESSGILHAEHNDIQTPHINDVEQQIYQELKSDPEIQNMDEGMHVLKDNPNRRLLLVKLDDDHNHSHEKKSESNHKGKHTEKEDEHHTHTHDPIVHSVFRKMGCLICLG